MKKRSPSRRASSRGAGADVIMLETFFNLSELELAVEAVRSVTKLPLVALMSFDSDAVTLAGVSAREAGERLRELDLAAFGANHGRGPAAALNALAEMAGDGRRPRSAAERRSGHVHGRPRRVPACNAGVLRRVRRPRAEPRRAVDRRLLRHDARADRGDPGRGRREPVRRGRRRGRVSSGTKRCRTRESSRPSWRGGSPHASSWSRCNSTRRSAGTPTG